VVDISNPANPVKVGFLNAGGTGYQTEGVQALHISTSAYTGDILVVSNEWCLPRSNPSLNPGGITIYDINDPTDPKRLVQASGDFDVHGNRANESHSAIAWDAGSRAFVAAIDNEEVEDVDLFEITNPRSPVLLSETSLPGVNIDAYGQEKTSHDFDVIRRPDGSWRLMVSDWDAGWIEVDVTDPANPTIVGDFDYQECEAVVTTACPPEGNAHQGEWNSDASVFVGTDEDLSPSRIPIEATSGPLSGQKFDGGEFGFTKPVSTFPNEEVNGPTVFGGYGCPDDTGEIPDPSVLGPLDPGEESIIVFQRGPVGDGNHPHASCFFSDKIRAGEEAGYDVVVIANHHAGAGGGEVPNAFFCGGQGSPVLGTAAALCVGHRFMHVAFGAQEDYTFPYPVPAPNEPAIGTLGPEIRATSEFDGWGHARVIDTSNPAAPTEVGQFTIPETGDPAFAFGFGDVDVHEVEVPRNDPDEGGTNPDTDRVAYYAWYSGGLRVMDLSDPANPQELGHYIDPAGNNFWGVALAEDNAGNRLILNSDRDFGLFIFRYTGDLP
jgi:LVIVD repeat